MHERHVAIQKIDGFAACKSQCASMGGASDPELSRQALIAQVHFPQGARSPKLLRFHSELARYIAKVYKPQECAA